MADWKDKYYASLESLEDKEKEWAETDQLLRRCISRITLAADGQNKKLDEQLERLRNSVRRERNYDRIRNMVDVIVEVASDTVIDKKTVSVKSLIDSLLKKLPYPDSLSKTRRGLIKRLDYMKNDDGIVDLFEGVLKLIESAIGEAVKDDGEQNKKETKKFLGGIFSGSKKNEEDKNEPVEEAEAKQQTVEDVIDIVRQVLMDLLMAIDVPISVAADLDALRSKTRRVETRKDLQVLLQGIAALVSADKSGRSETPDIPDKQESSDENNVINSSEQSEISTSEHVQDVEAVGINEILIQLLERLDLPEELVEQAASLKAEWEKGIDDDHIASALEAIADLVIKMRTRIEHEKNDFQKFLQQVTEKLQMLDQHIQDNVEDQKNIYDENKKFSDNVDGEVEQMQSDVQDAIDLAALKTSIANKLSKITKHVDSFRTAEESRKLQMEIRVGELASKVHQLETESQGLQERLVEEQKNAMLDTLTQIPNRLAWDQRMDYEYNRWKRYKSALVIVIWDIDDFKKVNDTYGHKAGDKVLSTIATLLKDQVRDTDFIARFGGEEFVMLLPETELGNAQAVVEKLRKGVEECEFHHGETRVPITVSGGMTQFTKGDSIESAFERADQFLYKAKASGKNRCLSELD